MTKLRQTYDNSRGVLRKSNIISENQSKLFRRKIIILVQFACRSAMLEGFKSF